MHNLTQEEVEDILNGYLLLFLGTNNPSSTTNGSSNSASTSNVSDMNENENLNLLLTREERGVWKVRKGKRVDGRDGWVSDAVSKMYFQVMEFIYISLYLRFSE